MTRSRAKPVMRGEANKVRCRIITPAATPPLSRPSGRPRSWPAPRRSAPLSRRSSPSWSRPSDRRQTAQTASAYTPESPKREQPWRDVGPINYQILTRRPHRRATYRSILIAPQPFLLSHQTAEIALRPLAPGGAGDRQQPGGRYPATRGLDPRRDQFCPRTELRGRAVRGGEPPSLARSTTRLRVL